MARYCTNCGAALDDTGRFCTNCGATIAPPQAPQAAPPPPPPPPQYQAPSPQYQQPPYQQPQPQYQQPQYQQQYQQQPGYQQPQYQAPPQYQPQATGSVNIVERAKSILLSPKTEWERIRDEGATTQSLIMGYAAVLAAIPAICNFVGGSIIGHSILGIFWRVPLAAGIVGMVLQYVLALVGVFVLGIIINALAPTFTSTPNSIQALKVAVYAATPSWIAGVFGIIPMLGLLAILGGLYGIYLLYLGLPVLMNTPQNQSVAYTIVVIIIAIVVFAIVGLISAGIIGAIGGFGPRMF